MSAPHRFFLARRMPRRVCSRQQPPGLRTVLLPRINEIEECLEVAGAWNLAALSPMREQGRVYVEMPRNRSLRHWSPGQTFTKPFMHAIEHTSLLIDGQYGE